MLREDMSVDPVPTVIAMIILWTMSTRALERSEASGSGRVMTFFSMVSQLSIYPERMSVRTTREGTPELGILSVVDFLKMNDQTIRMGISLIFVWAKKLTSICPVSIANVGVPILDTSLGIILAAAKGTKIFKPTESRKIFRMI